MKKMILSHCLVLILISFSSISAKAAETVPLEPLPLTTQEANAAVAGHFSAVITKDGQLISRPGTVFTEGIEGEEVRLPYVLSTPKLITYPRWAMRQGWEGEFILAVEVLPNGDVGRYYIMKSTGHDALDEAATDAVKTWKFQPAMENGKPVLTCVQIPVSFEIQNN